MSNKMDVFRLNAIFSSIFIVWCIFAIIGIPYVNSWKEPKIHIDSVFQLFYGIIAFAVLRNIWAYRHDDRYKKKCYPISIGGFAIFNIVHILLCFHYTTLSGGSMPEREKAYFFLLMLIPTLPLGLFGFALSFYCNLRIQIPIFDRGGPVNYFALFPCYAILALSLSTSALYFLYLSKGRVVFTDQAITTHTSIVIGAILIIIGFISRNKIFFFGASLLLGFAGVLYAELCSKMIYFGLHETIENLKADEYVLSFHIFTVVFYVYIGVVMCWYASKPSADNINEDNNPKINIKVITKHMILPTTKVHYQQF